MGNGMPISAIVGKAKIMKFFDEIFIQEHLEEKLYLLSQVYSQLSI